MKLFHDCGAKLVVRHVLEIVLDSDFDYRKDKSKFLRHHIKDSPNFQPFFTIDDDTKIMCSHCGVQIKDLTDAFFRCDECGNKYPLNEIIHIGKTLIICQNCQHKNKIFEEFTIFGRRKGKDARQKIIDDELNRARINTNSESRVNVPVPLRRLNEQFRFLSEEGVEE